MELEHSFTIPVSPERAWQVLLDVEQIAPCMPGATVESVQGDVISGRIKVKVGPVTLTYSGTAHFTERDEQGRTVILEASGKETRGSGTASATVRSSLRGEGGQTRVIVHTTMSVTGRPAQFGRGVMAEVGGKIIERFATNLAAQLAGAGQLAASAVAGNGAGPGAAAPGPAAPAAATPPGATPPSGTAATATAGLPIEDLHLPVRAFNSLRREGIHTVGDLSARTEAQLLGIDGLGPQSVKEIKQKLAGHGSGLATAPGAGAGPAAAVPAGQGGTAGPAAVPAALADTATATGAAARPVAPAPPLPPRPPDEEAIDLLSVAGFPVLKRVLPVAGVLVALLLLLGRARRRRRRAASGT